MKQVFSLLDPIPRETKSLTNTKFIEAGTKADFVEAASLNQTLSNRWGFQEVFCNGFVAVPTLFLQIYASLKPHPLTLGEAMFVLELMTYKWTKQHPYPGYKSIAERMGITDKMVRRYAQQLEAKRYLHRGLRKNQTNEFDLSGLFRALLAAANEPRKRANTVGNTAFK